MNILHMKYAVEVARSGSVNKASETLYIAQPNLSRAIKELEGELGITIFERSARGMVMTAEGEEFIGYAEKILSQIDDVEKMYKSGENRKQRFSVSVPRASYISDAFAKFSRSIGNAPAEIIYKETNALRAIKNILNSDYKLGIIRYAKTYESHFASTLAEKGLASELVTEFHYVVVASKESSLAALGTVRYSDLKDKIEIAHADPFVPSIPMSEVKKEELPDDVERRIFVFERGSQFELLSSNPETYMWVSPIPRETLDRFGLVELDCPDNQKVYRDVLIYRRDYKLTELDRRFIKEVAKSKEHSFNK
ncbi:MAG: LysR family transcriptional regulator [Clostridia bacterium]|nr:LysR family transcriptional regulator [Clostridia bacterium]